MDISDLSGEFREGFKKYWIVFVLIGTIGVPIWEYVEHNKELNRNIQRLENTIYGDSEINDEGLEGEFNRLEHDVRGDTVNGSSPTVSLAQLRTLYLELPESLRTHFNTLAFATPGEQTFLEKEIADYVDTTTARLLTDALADDAEFPTDLTNAYNGADTALRDELLNFIKGEFRNEIQAANEAFTNQAITDQLNDRLLGLSERLDSLEEWSLRECDDDEDGQFGCEFLSDTFDEIEGQLEDIGEEIDVFRQDNCLNMASGDAKSMAEALADQPHALRQDFNRYIDEEKLAPMDINATYARTCEDHYFFVDWRCGESEVEMNAMSALFNLRDNLERAYYGTEVFIVSKDDMSVIENFMCTTSE